MKRLALIALLATPAVAQEPRPHGFTGVYIEGSLQGQSQILDNKVQRTVKQGGIGAGINLPLGDKIVAGPMVRLDLGSATREVGVGARVGYVLNPGVLLYAPIMYSMDGSKHLNAANGVLSAGAGAEIVVSKSVTAFFELQRDLAKAGEARELNQVTTGRVGARVKF
jgi:hypothetical protein